RLGLDGEELGNLKSEIALCVEELGGEIKDELRRILSARHARKARDRRDLGDGFGGGGGHLGAPLTCVVRLVVRRSERQGQHISHLLGIASIQTKTLSWSVCVPQIPQERSVADDLGEGKELRDLEGEFSLR